VLVWAAKGFPRFKEKLLMRFHGVAVIPEKKKAIESSFRKMSFFLQFEKITVYSVCHRSVACVV
jgi:hypothetical protein